MTAEHFLLCKPAAPWGDYGDMLMHGMVDGHTCWDEPVSVARTGPFVPPISFPFGELLVTAEVRAAMEEAGFTGFGFEEARYGKTVRLDWRGWDLEAEEPARYPPGGEPETYIARGKHDAALAREMPPLSVVLAPPTPGLQKEGTRSIFRAHAPEADLFRTHMLLFVSERFREFLETEFGDWILCVPAEFAG